MNEATKRAIEHAERLSVQFAQSGEEPSTEELTQAARDVAAAIPGPVGDVLSIAITVAKLTMALLELARETRDPRAAALGSAAGLAAYRASQGAR